MSGGNGHVAEMRVPGDERAKRCVTLALTFDPLTFALEIGGEIASYDMARAILAQADRWFETRQRQAAAVELRNQLAQAARDEALARSVRGRM